jgi:hypothetical protein
MRYNRGSKGRCEASLITGATLMIDGGWTIQ